MRRRVAWYKFLVHVPVASPWTFPGYVRALYLTRGSIYLLLVNCSLILFLDPDDQEFLRNVGKFIPHYEALHPKIYSNALVSG
jgi:hypothetical protein